MKKIPWGKIAIGGVLGVIGIAVFKAATAKSDVIAQKGETWTFMYGLSKQLTQPELDQFRNFETTRSSSVATVTNARTAGPVGVFPAVAYLDVTYKIDAPVTKEPVVDIPNTNARATLLQAEGGGHLVLL